MKTFFSEGRVFCLEIFHQMVCSLQQIAGTHGGGIGHAMEFTETLYLHGTDKGNQCVGKGVSFSKGKKNHDNQSQNFKEKHCLPPVQG